MWKPDQSTRFSVFAKKVFDWCDNLAQTGFSVDHWSEHWTNRARLVRPWSAQKAPSYQKRSASPLKVSSPARKNKRLPLEMFGSTKVPKDKVITRKYHPSRGRSEHRSLRRRKQFQALVVCFKCRPRSDWGTKRHRFEADCCFRFKPERKNQAVGVVPKYN